MRYFITGALGLITALLYLLNSRNSRSIEEHLSKHHPKIWAKYQFPKTNAGFVEPADDSKFVSAQFAFLHSIRSGELRSLNDRTLNVLLRRRTILFWCSVVTLSALAAALMA